MPTNGVSIKRLKVKLSAGEQKATELPGSRQTLGGLPTWRTRDARPWAHFGCRRWRRTPASPPPLWCETSPKVPRRGTVDGRNPPKNPWNYCAGGLRTSSYPDTTLLSLVHPILHLFETMGSHCLFVFAGESFIPGFLRWCRIWSIHSMAVVVKTVLGSNFGW